MAPPWSEAYLAACTLRQQDLRHRRVLGLRGLRRRLPLLYLRLHGAQVRVGGADGAPAAAAGEARSRRHLAGRSLFAVLLSHWLLGCESLRGLLLRWLSSVSLILG